MRRLGPLYPGAVALVHSTPWRWPESIGNEARSPAWVVALGVPIGVVAWLVAAAIVALPPAHWLGAFVATAVAGRWAAIFLQALGDPIVDDDSPRSLVATPAPLWLVGAISAAVLAVGIVALGKVAIVAFALVAGIAFALGLDAQRRDRGLSAPVVATAAAAGELIVLLAATI